MLALPAGASSIVSYPESIASISISHFSDASMQKHRVSSITKRQWIVAVTLVVSGFLQGLVFACLAPFFPKEAEDKGASAAEIGLIFGIYQVVVAISAPVSGKLIKHTGAKFMLLAGLFTNGVTTLLFSSLAESPPGPTFIGLAMAIRVFQAVGDAGAVNAMFSIIAKEFSNRISTFVAVVGTAVDLGQALGPLFGGSLYDLGRFRLPFLVLGVLVLLCMFGCMIFIPKDMATENNEGSEHGQSVSYLRFLKSPVTMILLLTSTVNTLGPSMLDPTLEPHLRMFHLSHGQVGLMFLLLGAASLVSSVSFGYLTDRFTIGKEIMVFGGFLVFFAFFLLGPSPLMHLPAVTLWLTGLSLSLAGFGLSMQIIPVFALLHLFAMSKGFPDSYETAGMLSGLFKSFTSLGLFLGPVLGSMGRDKIGFGWTTSIFALAYLAAGSVLLIYVIFFDRRRDGADSEKLPLKIAISIDSVEKNNFV